MAIRLPSSAVRILTARRPSQGASVAPPRKAHRWPPKAQDGGMRDRRRRMLRTEVSTRDRLQPWARTKQAYPGVGVFLLATGGKVLAVIAVEWSDILVGVGTVENCALAVRQ
jgi:hypothetical protein